MSTERIPNFCISNLKRWSILFLYLFC
jgi:hypothetical protein